MDCVEFIMLSAEDLSCIPEAWPADEEDWGFKFHKGRESILNAAQDLLEELKSVREGVSPENL